MHTIDPRRLEPYQEHPLTDEERQECLDRLTARATRYTDAPISDLQRERWVHRTVIWRAENAWLEANFPSGAVFMHMGVPVMVIGKAPTTDNRGPAHAAIQAHCAAPNGGLQVLIFEVPQLRAILEPGYIPPARDPLFYGA